MPLPGLKTLRDEAEVSMQEDRLDLRTNHELSPVSFLQCRTSQYNGLPRRDPADYRIVQCLKPRSPVGICERDAGAHLGDIGSGVEIVSIGRGPPKLLSEGLPDRGLPDAANPHEQDDHRTFPCIRPDENIRPKP